MSYDVPGDMEALAQGPPGALRCLLCAAIDQQTILAAYAVDGYSMCKQHALDVLNRHPSIYYDMNDRLAIRATIDHGIALRGPVISIDTERPAR